MSGVTAEQKNYPHLYQAWQVAVFASDKPLTFKRFVGQQVLAQDPFGKLKLLGLFYAAQCEKLEEMRSPVSASTGSSGSMTSGSPAVDSPSMSRRDMSRRDMSRRDMSRRDMSRRDRTALTLMEVSRPANFRDPCDLEVAQAFTK